MQLQLINFCDSKDVFSVLSDSFIVTQASEHFPLSSQSSLCVGKPFWEFTAISATL